jgi:hypothetical protein
MDGREPLGRPCRFSGTSLALHVSFNPRVARTRVGETPRRRMSWLNDSCGHCLESFDAHSTGADDILADAPKTRCLIPAHPGHFESLRGVPLERFIYMARGGTRESVEDENRRRTRSTGIFSRRFALRAPRRAPK